MLIHGEMPSVAYWDYGRRSVEALLARLVLLPPVNGLVLCAPLIVGDASAGTSPDRAQIASRARETARTILDGLSLRALVDLDHALRGPTLRDLDPFGLPWTRLARSDAARLGQVSRDLVVDAFLSMHPDGYIREDAVARLEPSPGALPWLALRSRDHVAAIADVAAGAAARHLAHHLTHHLTGPAAIVRVLPLLDRLFSHLDPPSELLTLGYRVVEADVTTALERARLLDEEAMVIIVRQLAHRGLLELHHVHELLLGGTNGMGQAPVATRWIAAQALEELHGRSEVGGRAGALRATLLSDRQPAIRALALRLVARLDGDRGEAAIDAALLDTDRSVRWTALDLKSSRGPFDASAFYRAQLGSAPSAAAILGFADTAPRGAWEELIPFVDEAPALAQAALRGMARLSRAESTEMRLFVTGDARRSVSRRALETLRHRMHDEHTLSELLRSPHPHVRAHAVVLIRALPWWRVLKLLVAASDVELGTDAQRDIGDWLRRLVSTQAWLPEDARAEIRILVARRDIDQAVRSPVEEGLAQMDAGRRRSLRR